MSPIRLIYHAQHNIWVTIDQDGFYCEINSQTPNGRDSGACLHTTDPRLTELEAVADAQDWIDAHTQFSAA